MFGLIRVAAASPRLAVADCQYNKEAILRLVEEAEEENVQILTFPELCLTGSSCADLFYQESLQRAAEKALLEIAAVTAEKNLLLVLGLPLAVKNKIYNVAAAVAGGRVLGFVPRSRATGQRQLAVFPKTETWQIPFGGNLVVLSRRQLFTTEGLSGLKIALEVGADAWAAVPPCTEAAAAGATLILHPAAEGETVVAPWRRRERLAVQSGTLAAGWVYAGAGIGESTQDMVCAGATLIFENGNLLAEGQRFSTEGVLTIADLDVGLLAAERRRRNDFAMDAAGWQEHEFTLELPQQTDLRREVARAPFAPETEEARAERCAEIFAIQTTAVAQRLAHTHAQRAVLGISGGLDSTLALLVLVRAFDQLGRSRKEIVGVTMPGFGTTDRTYQNALALMDGLGITREKISIVPSLLQHLADINHDPKNHNVAYENAQARERTQILMDLANDRNGLVIGTGDLSELALGWATYNGDHMSMYGVNAGVPKTVVRLVVDWVSRQDGLGDGVSEILRDVLDTPISPELLPPDEAGDIRQKTEDIVGPYELHDFFLYYVVRCGFAPGKIFLYAKQAWGDVYDDRTLLKWLRNFYHRFFQQQFKRSCMPDGPLVGSVTLSPRGGWQMPSDACSALWLEQIEELMKETVGEVSSV